MADCLYNSHDKENNLIGIVTDKVVIDNSMSPIEKRLFVATEGRPENSGSIESPWDLETGLISVEKGDVLYIRGGTYTHNVAIVKSGTENQPITVMNYLGEKVELVGAGIPICNEF